MATVAVGQDRWHKNREGGEGHVRVPQSERLPGVGMHELPCRVGLQEQGKLQMFQLQEPFTWSGYGMRWGKGKEGVENEVGKEAGGWLLLEP